MTANVLRLMAGVDQPNTFERFRRLPLGAVIGRFDYSNYKTKNMSKFFYKIEEQRTFKKPTVYRLTFSYYKRFLWFKWIFHPERNYVDESNQACWENEAFHTESKSEIEAFKSFCIECDKNE